MYPDRPTRQELDRAEEEHDTAMLLSERRDWDTRPTLAEREAARLKRLHAVNWISDRAADDGEVESEKI
jgi:hypothetical protein